MSQLEALGFVNDTVVCLTSDHGYKVCGLPGVEHETLTLPMLHLQPLF